MAKKHQTRGVGSPLDPRLDVHYIGNSIRVFTSNTGVSLTLHFVNSGFGKGVVFSATLQTLVGIYHASTRDLNPERLSDTKPHPLTAVDTCLLVFEAWRQEEGESDLHKNMKKMFRKPILDACH